MEYSELSETIEVPWQQLSADALQGLLEEFVTRDGTDYGMQEAGLESRCRQVRKQLEDGRAIILFSQESGLCNIVTRESLGR